jgi:hypothetical protein
MARGESPPFERGTTFVNGAYTISSDDLPGTQHEGKEWDFEDIDLSQTGARPARTNHMVKCIAVRNMASFAIRPKAIVTGLLTAGVNFARTGGMCRVTAENVLGVADEYLPSAGCPQYDLFWCVVRGPSLVLSPLSNTSADIAVGNVLVALTAATSGATTSGRPTNQDLTGATAVLGEQVMNKVGRAMSLNSTNSTNASVLIYVRDW